MKETNKIVQDLNMRIEAIKERKTEAILQMENLGKNKRDIDTSPNTFPSIYFPCMFVHHGQARVQKTALKFPRTGIR